jgi:hypothetical protein
MLQDLRIALSKKSNPISEPMRRSGRRDPITLSPS